MKKANKLLALLLAFILVMLSLSACKTELPRDFSNDYNPETDFQFALEFDEIGISYITEAPDGYYFLNESFIYYLDKKTMTAMPFCKKPDCLHDEYDRYGGLEVPCEAYIEGSGNLGNSIFYFDNAIYILTTKHINGGYSLKNVLVKYALDGTLLEDFYIFPGIPQAIIRHRDMVYYTYKDTTALGGGNIDGTYKLVSVSLKDKTETEIMSDPLIAELSFDKLFAYGKYVYINDEGFPKDSNQSESDYIHQIIVYDIETGESSVMEFPEEKAFPSIPVPYKDELVFSFFYYSGEDERNKQLYKIGLDGKNAEKLFSVDSTNFKIRSDDSYIYEDNRNECMDANASDGESVTRKILVYNDTFELVDTITFDKVNNNPENYDFSCDGYKVAAVSEDYLFIKTGSCNENDDLVYTLICVDKKQIGTGNVTPFLVWSDVIESNQ